MNFIPLKPHPVASTSGAILINCLITGQSKRWNEAAAAGWVSDTDGPPFRAYYSPEAVTMLERETVPREQDEPHASDCGVWVDEGCTCIMGRLP